MKSDYFKLPPIEDAFKPGTPITMLQEPTPQDGDYVATLEEWGGLPEILSLPDAAAFVAHRCRQNPQAVRKVLEDAVQTGEIRFWGLTGQGDAAEWKPFLLRMVHRFAKGGVTPTEDGQGVMVTGIIERTGRLHSEVMGVNAVDVVQLLRRRGRKIPEALLSLLRADEPAEAVAPVQRSVAHEMNILAAIKSLGLDPLALPRSIKGAPGAKSRVRAVTKGMTQKVFDKAWQRLRDSKQIEDAE